ncbi:MAG: arginine--tRNA ligase, partial [Candidatus Obscuribacterales bacterium]|nr:arginine--tRNA ligase [Candidatus Obscuribacterales bacterium]
MKNAINIIQRSLKEAAQKAFADRLSNFEPSVVTASNPSFGDFQCNAAMTLAKELKLAPRAIAEQILAQIQENEAFESPSIAGAGFINIKLKKEFLEAQLNGILGDKRLGVAKAPAPKNVVVDMSSPNIAKEMHVGHLRSTIIGDSISRTYEFLGHNVLKLNHVGDWGTQFGMLIAELKEKYPAALTKSEALDLGDLVDFYKQSKKHFDEDPEFKAHAHQEVVRLQSGDPDSKKAWQLLCNQSRKAFDEIYQILNIQNLNERGESFYNDMLLATVNELEAMGVAVVDQGAKCVFLDGYLNEEGKPLPLIVQKKDGGFNYAATDIAALRYRVEHDKADEIIYVVGAEQALHLQMMLKASKKAGWLPDNVRTEHVGFGAVLGEDGKKLKTRSGETVRLKDLLDEAVQHAREDLDARLSEKGRSESEEWKTEVSKMIGIA